MNQSNYYPSQDPIIKLRQEMKLRGFSRKTIKSYLYYTSDCLKKSNKPIREINGQDVRGYLEGLVNLGMSASTLNCAYSAFQLYFEKILCRKFFFNIVSLLYGTGARVSELTHIKMRDVDLDSKVDPIVKTRMVSTLKSAGQLSGFFCIIC